MPSKYPVLSSNEVVKILETEGFVRISQRGSHLKMRKEDKTVIVPMHSEIAKGTLKSILIQAGLTVDDILPYI